jgi:predicted TIM-barrel fold metal-dependent hydrolase
MAAEQLPLTQFEPRSMLRVRESFVPKPKFPVLEFHSHLTWSKGLRPGEEITVIAEPPELLPVLDAKDVRVMVNRTGGYGEGLRKAIATHVTPHPNRFVVFTEPWWSRVNEPGYADFQAGEVIRACELGARGLKILKTLGLGAREHGDAGPFIKVDDPRFDPMWEAAGAMRMPVMIHVSDPRAFFEPVDRFNERWEELHHWPEWSFHGPQFPSNLELQEARRRVMKRHPRTNFVCAHFADAEDLAYVSELMDDCPNMYVDFSARIAELGRQPRATGRFFERYQDRIVFGTDAIPRDRRFPQQVFGEALYEIYYRFLETDDEYFDYAPARVPPQGRWRIYGLGLPDSILRKVYWENGARLLEMDPALFT